MSKCITRKWSLTKRKFVIGKTIEKKKSFDLRKTFDSIINSPWKLFEEQYQQINKSAAKAAISFFFKKKSSGGLNFTLSLFPFHPRSNAPYSPSGQNV